MRRGGAGCCASAASVKPTDAGHATMVARAKAATLRIIDRLIGAQQVWMRHGTPAIFRLLVAMIGLLLTARSAKSCRFRGFVRPRVTLPVSIRRRSARTGHTSKYHKAVVDP